MSYYPTPKHPLREALAAVVGKDPPDYVQGFDFKSLTDKQQLDLQDWCSLNARPFWATGLSMLEAAELIVAGAIENGNIDPEKKSDHVPYKSSRGPLCPGCGFLACIGSTDVCDMMELARERR